MTTSDEEYIRRMRRTPGHPFYDIDHDIEEFGRERRELQKALLGNTENLNEYFNRLTELMEQFEAMTRVAMEKHEDVLSRIRRMSRTAELLNGGEQVGPDTEQTVSEGNTSENDQSSTD